MTGPARRDSWGLGVWLAHVVIFTATGAALIFGPERWVSSNSLLIIRQYSHLPWPAVGGLWLLAAALLFHSRTRAVGYVLGATMGIIFVGCVITYTVLPGETSNVVVSFLALLSPLMSYAGARYAIRNAPPRKPKGDR